MVIYLVAGGIAIFLVIVAVSMMSAAKRTEAWRQAASELGLAFEGKESDLLSKFGHLRLLSRGRSRRAYNVIAGNTGEVAISVGDYRYTTGSGKNSRTHQQTICVLQSQDLNLTHCYLRPESRFFDVLGKLFGGQDINFDEDSAFSGAFVLQGDNENAIRQVFDGPTRAWFAQRRSSRFHFEVIGDVLMFHTGRRVRPDQARELMQQALEVLKLLSQKSVG